MDNEANSLKKTARLAGLLYIVTQIPGAMTLIYVPTHIIVDNNAAATTNNILADEFLFRLSIIGQLTSLILFILLALVLYRLFKQVNQFQAKLLVVFVFVQVPIVFLLEILNFTSLMIAKDVILKSVQTEQRQNLIMLFIAMHQFGMMMLEIFWGLWLIPFGLLVYKSGFIPRIFALCLFIGGIGWVSDSITYLLLPRYHTFLSQYIVLIGAIGEFPTMLWLLIKGVKPSNSTIGKE
jgi:hypothetical protein